MNARPNRLTELLERMREAYEIGSPLIVQQRLFCDFSVCLTLSGGSPPAMDLPLSEASLGELESHWGRQNRRSL